jgi:16S rRNA C967 or C1407 C5-methylase (RsmB/RsmF family)
LEKTIHALNIIAAALLLVSPARCTTKEDLEKRDYKKLKTVMLRISKVHEDHLSLEVQRMETLELETERVRAIRDSCLKAYRKFILAYQKSREADKVIDAIEESDPSVVPVESLLEMKHEAEDLLNESNGLLKEAEQLKDDCHGRLDDMEKPDRGS